MSAPFKVAIAPQGWQFEADAGVPLLAAAERAGVRLPSSCRNGTCRTCLCRLLEGRVGYAIDWPGVSREERRDGYILPCVALAESDLTLEAPAARLMAAPAASS
ncbi:2Fe-2S iron-sulfur cluster-binding protein [Janthinobacterium fluminis]|uniref:2Fe-2S iron-sulfur cluster-binding protein n=1 Tax=Janthinobacterium fluminis TaxID=2987524 RepID=A0ABT5KAM0_9BURK|nr:2Fe-2S iron-sulfur cluster-binding protein [Janthinobacterium fluminis]MDC8760872.1 2Fe-2S iron-sulfur cluster-binding protein [Janthinobacterium fluminis]